MERNEFGMTARFIPCRFCGKKVPSRVESKCFPTLKNQTYKEALHRNARFGDLHHKLDVNLALHLLGASSKDIEVISQRYISAEAQTSYWNGLPPSFKTHLFQPVGASPTEVSTAFEGNYFSSFRRRYVEEHFPMVSEDLLSFNRHIDEFHFSLKTYSVSQGS